MMRRRVPMPWDAVELSPAELASIKAVADGAADPHQQRLAIRTITHKLCQINKLGWTAGPDGPRATDFAGGKQWVGFTIHNDILGREYPVNPRGKEPPLPAPEEMAAASTEGEKP